MHIYRHTQININDLKQIHSKNDWTPTQSTLLSRILIAFTAFIAIGGLCAAVVVPIIYAVVEDSSQTTTTSTTTLIGTTTTVTTTPRYPISCFASATASNFYSPAGTVTQQLDGLLDRPNTSGGTYFHSGALPPQWIKLELPGLFNILTITLQVIQSPNGPTRHQISVGSSSSSLQIVTDLSSSTINGQILNFTYNPILTNVRFIRLTTITSPSWVAWQKLIVYDF